jgi:hypothetical protein
MIAGLVHTGLARARREIVEAGGPPIEVIRITVTNAGRSKVDRAQTVGTSRPVVR